MKTTVKCQACGLSYSVETLDYTYSIGCKCGQRVGVPPALYAVGEPKKKKDTKNIRDIGCLAVLLAFVVVAILSPIIKYVCSISYDSAPIQSSQVSSERDKSSTCSESSERKPAKKNTTVLNQWGRMADNRMGFTHEKDLDKFRDLLISEDLDAATRFAVQLADISYATLIEVGTEVFVDDISFFRETSHVRRRGETQSWWVDTAAVKPVE